MYPWNRKINKLLEIAEKIEEARAKLVDAETAAASSSVGVTDPLAASIVTIDQSLAALDAEIGPEARKEHRERPREAVEAVG